MTPLPINPAAARPRSTLDSAHRPWARRLRARYGPWAVVTGASSGIGRALAHRLAEAGMNLFLVARNKAPLETLAAHLAEEFLIETKALALDLAGAEGMSLLLSATDKSEVGLLVAAAGFGTSGYFLQSPLEPELEMLALNCRAVTNSSWHFGNRFAAQGRGGIILFGSIVGFQGMPFAAHYAATKAYVQTLGEALAVELAHTGVEVLTVAPGPVRSGFGARAGMKMGVASDPADIALPILKALGRRSTYLPGFLAKFLTWSLAPLPRAARVRVMGQVMFGMIKHRLGSPTPTNEL